MSYTPLYLVSSKEISNKTDDKLRAILAPLPNMGYSMYNVIKEFLASKKLELPNDKRWGLEELFGGDLYSTCRPLYTSGTISYSMAIGSTNKRTSFVGKQLHNNRILFTFSDLNGSHLKSISTINYIFYTAVTDETALYTLIQERLDLEEKVCFYDAMILFPFFKFKNDIGTDGSIEHDNKDVCLFQSIQFLSLIDSNSYTNHWFVGEVEKK